VQCYVVLRFPGFVFLLVFFCFRVCFDFLILWLNLLQVGEFAASFDNPFLQLLLESSAANAVQKYCCDWQRWKAWACSKLGVPVLPAIPLQVALYLTELVDRAVR